MTRDEGFSVMDVSTSFLQDPKVRRLQRHAPDRWPVAMIAYISAMSESWKAGRRVSIEDAWPVGLPYDDLAAEGLVQVGLVDASGLIVPRTWRSWFGKAKARRAKTRADWRKWQQDHRKSHGGVSPDSTPDKSIPSVRPSAPSDPSVQSGPSVSARARGEKHGLKAMKNHDEAIAALDQKYADGLIDGAEYKRQRKALEAA